MTLEKMAEILEYGDKNEDTMICIAIEFPFRNIPKGDVGIVVSVDLTKRTFKVKDPFGEIFEAKETEIDMVEYLYNFKKPNAEE